MEKKNIEPNENTLYVNRLVSLERQMSRYK